MRLDISLQCLQVFLLLITLNQPNPVHALPTLYFRTILILFFVCVFLMVALFMFNQKNCRLFSLSHGTRHLREKGAPEKKREHVVDGETKATILYEYRDSPVGGHRGMIKTFKEIRERFEWPDMKREIQRYVKRCRSCQLNKNLSPRRKAPMEITATASQPTLREVCARYSGTDWSNK